MLRTARSATSSSLEDADLSDLSKKVARRRKKPASKDPLTLWILKQISKIYTPATEVPLVSIVSLDEIKDPSLPSTLSTKLRSSSLWSTFPKLPRPSLWRDAGHKLRLAYYQLALDSQGPSFKFDVRLSEELMAEGRRDSQGFTDLVRRRVALHLKRKLGRPVDFWFVIETKPKAKHPHLHGAVAISEQERVHLRRALLVASNTKGEFRKFAVRTKQVTYGFGVAGYAMKSLSRTTLEFPGQNVTATHRVKRAAQKIFERDRAWIINMLVLYRADRLKRRRRGASFKRPTRP